MKQIFFRTISTAVLILSLICLNSSFAFSTECENEPCVQTYSILDDVRSTITQAEVSEITKMIYLDYISGDELPTSETLSTYLQSKFRTDETSRRITRDVSSDLFGTPYRIEYPNPTSVRVTSAGVDKNFDTADDLYSQRELN